MSKQEIGKALVSVTSMTAGAILSRLTVDKIPIKSTKTKRTILIVAGLVAGISLDRKKTLNSGLADASLSLAATQVGYLIKDCFPEDLKEKNPKAYQALGHPNWSYENELDSSTFLSSYIDDDFIDYEEVPQEIEFEEIEEFNS